MIQGFILSTILYYLDQQYYIWIETHISNNDIGYNLDN